VFDLVPYSFEPRWPGLGQAGQPPGEISQISSQVGGSLLAIAPATGPAAPFVAAAGGVAELVGAVSRLFQGCGATCTEATTIVNQVEPYLVQNNQLYFTNPNRTTGDQAAALATFEQIWATVQKNCGNPQLGTAGQNCINERGPNATNCTFGKTTANEYPPYCAVPYPVGVCWNWFLAYYDPILNDVPPGGSGPASSAATAATATPATGTTSDVGSYLPLLLGLGAIALLFMVME
jgi:hypothetical protein